MKPRIYFWLPGYLLTQLFPIRHYMRLLGILLFLLTAACTPDTEQPGSAAGKSALAKGDPPPPPPPGYPIYRADSSCRAELEQARKGAQENKLTYVSFDRQLRYRQELEALLARQEIKLIHIPMNCTGELYCYRFYMDSIMVRRRGAGFIDSLKQVADKQFVSAWATKTYRSWDVDTRPTCGPDDIHRYVTSRVCQPAGWDPKPKNGPYFNNERQYIQMRFVVDTLGLISIIRSDTDSSGNIKASNRRHLPYFRREITRILQQTGRWQPATLNGHKVRCQSWVDVTLNPESN
ncbi:hypothetical protein [Hymenobacter cellulosilyticus]|uniref:Uncharacterized protein n=1 Tax=Hymenobacter cellulosilyticus TaxID=2932248 RepID=A0A8T9Q799_9BACT|nr:hypothetical protein [Hymenobacter cellulosilyticus]UOQ73457.1 hypothetical protein MUN79_05820 [Hymenobacter cellulosilyticus]